MIASQNIQNGDAEIGGGDAPPPPKVSNKKMTIEKIYQKKSQREHILLRPDTYIGSVEPVEEPMWVYNSENKIMEQKTITYVPGLYKIFDEIIVNAADNKQRDPTMNSIKVDIDAENNTISIWNNGKGIPVVEHKDEKMYVPTMIFGHLLTSSNYNDIEEKVTGGRNGFGAKLCNIFSTKFTVETASSDDLKLFKQSWADNMTKATEPKIKVYTGSNDFTKVTFSPDLKKFKMTHLDEDIVALLSRRAFDIAASSGVSVSLNGKTVPVKNFSSYISLYLKDKTDDLGNPLKPVYERVGERWEVAVTISSNGFQQVSFVNSIATTKGGRHVDHVSDSIVKHIVEMLKKKNRKGLALKANQIKQNLWLFINCLIVNPTFDSQTKEHMTLQVKNFGSKCVLSEKFFSSISKSNVLDILLNYAKIEQDKALGKAHGGKKKNKPKISKLDDAIDAGSQKSMDCTLILTEGDSAKTLAVSGLGVVGRTKYGIFPLRGKLLNVREAPVKQIMNNTEINHIMEILGLKYKTVFETEKDLKSLRYGRLMIMTDQDQDGSHIKGLLINFIHHNWPSLLRLPFLEEFITPIVKAIKGKKELSFYSIPEYEEWKAATENWHTYKIKYYKGLGTSTSKEAKEYFADMKRHRIIFKYGGPNDDNNITMAFSRKCVDQRKEWLTHWMESMKQRRELGLPEQYLYEKDTKAINYSDFVNKELVLFSNSDNERSIPSMIDGLKPGQRKVLFTCLKRKDKREVKVAQLAGSVAEHSAYHHGEQSLMSTIINLAQNFVGSNNINVLQPIGQFGSRLCGGKDAASPRYIFTKLSPLTQYIFNPLDEVLLKYQFDDNQKIEPTWYVPLIPMVLVNGADGIGTGWMTKIPNYNPRELVNNIYKLLDGEEPIPMKPWYKNFRGVVEVDSMTAPLRYVTFGEIALLGDDTLEISELPVGVWTNQYKEFLENLMRTDNKTPGAILDYEDHSSDISVRFVITMKPDKLKMAEEEGLHKFFKLQATCNLLNMCAFDANGCLKKYDSALDILKEFYAVRLEYYEKRKSYLEGVLQAESLKLSNQARFILEKCSGQLTVENKKRKAMIDELEKKGYDADPVRVWKLKQNKDETLTEEADSEETQEDEDKQDKDAKVKYDYLLGMAMWSLTLERKNAILKQRDEKLQEYETLRAKTAAMLWREDLASFMKKLDEVETQEQQEAESEKGRHAPKKGTTQKSKRPVVDTRPADFGERIVPRLDADLLKKFDKTSTAKEKKVKVPKKKTDEEKDEFDTLDKPGKSLKERLGNSPEIIEKKMNAKRKERKSTKSGKGKKKRFGTFSDSDNDFKDSGSEEEFSPKTAPSKEQPRREVSRRQAAAKVKFSYSDEDQQFSDEDEEFVDNSANVDEHHNPEVMADETVNVSDTDSEFDASPEKSKPAESSDAMFDSLVQSPEKNSPSPQKKAQPKKRQLGKVNSTKVKKPSAPAKRSKKTAMSSDSDEGMFVPKAKKGKKKESVESDEEVSRRATTGRAKKAPKYAFSNDEDEDDSDIYVESD